MRYHLIESFLKDDWANLVSGSSLMSEATMKHLKENGVKTWQRSLDKVFSLYASSNFIKNDGAYLMQNLSASLKKESIVEGLSGFAITSQFFPRGYELWSSKEPQLLKPKEKSKISKVKIIIPDNTYAIPFKNTIANAFKELGITADCELIAVSLVGDRMKKGDFDILATGIAVADPNFEGAMSFFFEREPAFIQSSSKPNDFSAQIKEARSLPTLQERSTQMRNIMIHAIEVGHVLPLFHFSSLAIAKPGVDISVIPNSDETVLFSKVRMQ